MERKIRLFLISAVAVVVGYFAGHFGTYYYQHKDDIYYSRFNYSLEVTGKDSVTIVGDCRKERVSLQVKEESVILSVGGVSMVGVPVLVTENNILFVKFSNGEILGFVLLKPNDTHKEEFLVILNRKSQVILSNIANCAEITSFLDKIQP